MSRQEDFIEAGIQYRFAHGTPMAIGGGNFAEMAKEMNRAKPFEAGAEYGYQYAQTHPNWISVEEKLPEENERVRAWSLENNEEYLCDYHDGIFEDFYGPFTDGKITHWMPLPQLPRKEDK